MVLGERANLESNSPKLDDVAFLQIIAIPLIELLKRLPRPVDGRLNDVLIYYAIVVEPVVVVFVVNARH
jgi:hypothetical protein